MKIGKLKRAVLPLVALGMLGAVMVGCNSTDIASGGTPTASDAVTSSQTPTIAINTDDLGDALAKLAFQGGGQAASADRTCLVNAVRGSGVPDTALASLIKIGGDDFGAVVAGVAKDDPAAATKLTSARVRTELDACVTKALEPKDGYAETSYPAPKPPTNPQQPEANTKPTIELRNRMLITSANQLTKGLVSMLSSYALDDSQKTKYQHAGECIARVVFDAGFSDEALHFFAGGAPLGSGELASFLPTDADKKLWRSAAVLTPVGDCMANAKPDDDADSDG